MSATSKVGRLIRVYGAFANASVELVEQQRSCLKDLLLAVGAFQKRAGKLWSSQCLCDQAKLGSCVDQRLLRADASRNRCLRVCGVTCFSMPARSAASCTASQITFGVIGLSARQLFTVPGNK